MNFGYKEVVLADDISLKDAIVIISNLCDAQASSTWLMYRGNEYSWCGGDCQCCAMRTDHGFLSLLNALILQEDR